MNAHLIRLLCLALCAQNVLAEEPTAETTPPAASIDAAIPVVETPATPAPVVKVAPPPPEPVEACKPLSFRAMAADVKAFTAQTQKIELLEQAQLFKDSVALWTKVVSQCDGRTKELGQRNLEESQKMLAKLGEQLVSGPQCTAAHKDATSLQEMAKQSLASRNWNEAAMLFRKAENLWELAIDDCAGTQQKIAKQRKEEAEIDGHNAEFCAPLYEKAREQTQKLRTSSAILTREDKQDASMNVEALWRDTATQCKGASAETARNNAQTIARERGTPWVDRAAMAAAANKAAETPPPPKRSSNLLSETTQPTPAKVAETKTAEVNITPLANSTPPASKLVTAPIITPAVTTVPAAAALSSTLKTSEPTSTPKPAEIAKPVENKPAEFSAEDAAGLNIYSGIGKIVWANGDVYQGDISQGMRHGKGKLIWANGQSYDGDWVNSKAEGRGIIKFPNGNIYEGSVVAGTPHGQGKMRYTSGDIYTGNFNQGEHDGAGVYVWKNGQKYEGEWSKGISHGKGRTVFINGASYTGQYVNGVSEGLGEYHWSNGDKYVGEWKSGKMHGQGTFTWQDGSKWEGIYNNGQKTEQGKLTRVETAPKP